jgi:hypothetical protein
MAWETRQGRRYYTRSKRVNGRIRREYVGGGAAGERAAAEDALRRAERKQAAEALKFESARHAWVAGRLDELGRVADRLLALALAEAGYHCHHGEWRRRPRDRHDANTA